MSEGLGEQVWNWWVNFWFSWWGLAVAVALIALAFYPKRRGTGGQ